MKVLVTRPGTQGVELCELIKKVGGTALHHPLIDIIPCKPNGNFIHQIQNADIIIAVSQHAVINAHHTLLESGSTWPANRIYLGVGQKTAHELSNTCKQNVHYPTTSDSENLLKLPELMDISGKTIIILRGNGGRELIHQQLTHRGAKVRYLEVYQRQFIPISSNDLDKWQSLTLETIIVTSGEQLDYLIAQTPEPARAWLTQLTLLVPSERIAKFAKMHEFRNVITTKGASNSTILAALQRLDTGLKHDEQK
ncbi:uroporphyrinogen-III synthase [Vibrio methylphosphonaticus]|uniref:uroporphyrinogen-III synthase n=1 Tax=Vibrio methylphosphonaticus TaxID=2946866 RepID=UPI002029F58B|nr:uroporphyrinogen-III synthase [Vibrio methylphosphonaticus]MCL9777525.1 uroporphyrinogen-III synthase [Vibrio methylphosphonaticus]